MAKKQINISALLILIFSLVGLGFLFYQKGEIKEVLAAPQPVTGWAWFGADCVDEDNCTTTTSPIGWISFNHLNPGITCGTINYSVRVDYQAPDPNNTIQGAAWVGIGENDIYDDCNTDERSLGWIDFDDTTTPPCGLGGYPSNYCFPARIVNGEIQGWAPIKSRNAADSIMTIGWVRFKGANYFVKIRGDGSVSKEPNEHYAWSGKGSERGFGWIDFANVQFPERIPTPHVSNPTAEFPNPCLQSRLPKFSWTTDASLPYDYELEVYSNPSYSGDPLFKIAGNNTSSTSWTPPCNYCCDIPPYNSVSFGEVTYYWRVRARNIDSNWSSWAESIFTTKKNCYPLPNFQCNGNENCSSLIIRENEEVNLSNFSTIYPPAGLDHCVWNLPSGSEVVSGNPNVSCLIKVRFVSGSNQTIGFEVFDTQGYHCPTQKSINVLPPFSPKWKEIPPF
jgi:hypothetical protein